MDEAGGAPDDWAPYDAGRDAHDDAGGWDSAEAGDASADTWLPPEEEETPDFHEPRGSNRFVYLSNPVGDDVVVIDSVRLTVDLVEVGDTPTELATLGTSDAAAVIDSGSDDVAIIRTSVSAGSRVAFQPIAPGPNAISVSPDGGYGVTFYDIDARSGPRPPNMQEVTLLLFDPEGEEASFRTTIGALATRVDWSDDSSHAFVIGWDGLSIVDFARVDDRYRPTHVSFGTVPIDPADPDGPVEARRVDDVDVSGDGEIAVLSEADVAQVLILDLDTRELTEVPLPSAPTDVDLAPDGSFALAALRDTGQVARIDLADPDAPEVLVTGVPGVIAGQVVLTADGDRAVVFSSAAEVEAIALLEIESGDSVVVTLEKWVRAVATTADGTVAVVIHDKKPGDPDDPLLDPVRDLDEIIDRTYGFSLVNFSDRVAVRQETPTDPGAWLVYGDEDRAFLTLRDDEAGVRELLMVDLETSVTDPIPLGSPPVSLGLAPFARKVFVGQEHPTGRISFIDVESGSVQTITGFELNDWIVE
jgi:DNA-binding beta-propeller fold protein YncE